MCVPNMIADQDTANCTTGAANPLVLNPRNGANVLAGFTVTAVMITTNVPVRAAPAPAVGEAIDAVSIEGVIPSESHHLLAQPQVHRQVVHAAST